MAPALGVKMETFGFEVRAEFDHFEPHTGVAAQLVHTTCGAQRKIVEATTQARQPLGRDGGPALTCRDSLRIARSIPGSNPGMAGVESIIRIEIGARSRLLAPLPDRKPVAYATRVS